MRRHYTVPFLLVLLVAAAAAIGLAALLRDEPKAEPAVASLDIFRAAKWTEHYRAPSDAGIETLLADAGIPLTAARRDQALRSFREEWAKRNPTTANPRRLRALLRHEREGSAAATRSQPMSLVVPVEFAGADTFGWFDGEATVTVSAQGPLHNRMAPPGPRDNVTVWYRDASPDLYAKLFFGIGPEAGVVIDHPNLGLMDLRGKTMANYYIEQSEGRFVPRGSIYPHWVQSTHSEAWYGADSASSSNMRVYDLVREVVDTIRTTDPQFPWQDYDDDDDGVVDNFTVVHAGFGQEVGGGDQGDFAIWSHASAIDMPRGYLACAKDSIRPGVPSRDIFVREYSMDPENLDVGVIAEEYGHAVFGLPDIYTNDVVGSPSTWALFELGAYNGVLAGMEPAPFPLVFRALLGWAKPVELDCTDVATTVKVGQLSRRPAGTKHGIRINLPDQRVEIPNPLGTGKAWWSDRGDVASYWLARAVDLSAATAPVFSFASSWSVETGYDFGYLEVSSDGGATWTRLGDMDGVCQADGAGARGVTGEGEGKLRFDLAPYAGTQIVLRLNYVTDVGVQWKGWWADDFLLADGGTTLFADDVENGAGDWTTNAWQQTPQTRTHPLYYMAEWRNLSGFDRGLNYPLQTVYFDGTTNEWEVDHPASTLPGMVLWLRNGAYEYDYGLLDSLADPPAMGPKHALLVVDSHYWPMAWDSSRYASGANLRIGAGVQAVDATFSLQQTTPFTLRLGYDPLNGVVVDTPLETKTFGSLAPVSQFHDSLGYYPGMWYRPADGKLYFWHDGASAVVPAKAGYTTRITDLEQNPLTSLYGRQIGGAELGTGNPRDAGAQYGLHIAVLDKARDGRWGKLAVWNAATLVRAKVAGPASVEPGMFLTYRLTVRNLSPATQPFRLSNPVPAGTAYVRGGVYDGRAHSVAWTGKLRAHQSRTLLLTVFVNAATASGTEITEAATLSDDASGSSASTTTVVRERREQKQKREARR